jgi:hypothetical protein
MSMPSAMMMSRLHDIRAFISGKRKQAAASRPLWISTLTLALDPVKKKRGGIRRVHISNGNPKTDNAEAVAWPLT